MTIRIPLLLLPLSAIASAPIQSVLSKPAKSTSAPSETARARRAVSDSSAAYARLRSYSGRFQMVSPFEVQSGEIRWALPNRLSMRIETKSKSGTFTRRALSDGQFLYITDSRLRGNFVKYPVGRSLLGTKGIGFLISAPNEESTMYMAGMMSGLDPLDGVGAVRITSSPKSPTLAMEVRFKISGVERGDARMKTTLSDPTKMSFRFGADKLLREFSMEESALEKMRATEKHWDIRLNPALADSTFQWKPAPGAREVDSLEVPR